MELDLRRFFIVPLLILSLWCVHGLREDPAIAKISTGTTDPLWKKKAGAGTVFHLLVVSVHPGNRRNRDGSLSKVSRSLRIQKRHCERSVRHCEQSEAIYKLIDV